MLFLCELANQHKFFFCHYILPELSIILPRLTGFSQGKLPLIHSICKNPRYKRLANDAPALKYLSLCVKTPYVLEIDSLHMKLQKIEE